MQKIILPAGVTRAEGKELYSFKQAAFARLEIEASGNGIVTASVGELLNADGWVDTAPPGSLYYYSGNIAVTGEAGIFALEFPPHESPYGRMPSTQDPPAGSGGEIAPFRFAELTVPDTVKIIAVRQRAFFGDVSEETAQFECSSPELNKVWDFCCYTISATGLFRCFVDGERERLPYEGDSYINLLSHFACGGSPTQPRETITELLKYPTWPTEWKILPPILAEYYLLYSGDQEAVNGWLPALKAQCEALLADCNASGLLTAKNGDRLDLIDYPPNEIQSYESGECNFVANAYFYAALQSMARLSGEEVWAERAANLKNSILNTMTYRNLPTDSPGSRHTSFHTALYALRFDLASEEKIPELLGILTTSGMACSVYTAQFLLETLYKYRESAYAMQLLTAPGMRGWLHMIDCGATMTMEAWDQSIKPNQDWNHAWGSAPGNIIPGFVAGVRPLGNGFSEFIIDPQPDTLEYFRYQVNTPHGTIKVAYNTGKLAFEVPENCTALCNGKRYAAGKYGNISFEPQKGVSL